ncbi:uncharacterized protein F5147DRAFT_772046 [Suillus discolor]|uniref:Uncharacterized protein n=1 Tax=Suillus discolor TaxID=1912936 RepID=A0A9P7JVX2_9AGAM|nr:uncharacterized protein F5147DRAFT_772046 [Suillus discolor]KAG2111328.1 hypothetical protein F5147DRAFT_772046 [Suillus discolor]
MGTELHSFEQCDEGVTAIQQRTAYQRLLIASGSSALTVLKVRRSLIPWMNGTEGVFAGIVHKQLGLTFLGETRDDIQIVTGDIRLTGVGLDRVICAVSKPVLKHWHLFGNFNKQGLSLCATDEIGEDGWQFYLYGRELDLTKIAESEELVFETIALLILTEITFKKVVWMSDFRANIWMVNKFSNLVNLSSASNPNCDLISTSIRV